MSNFDKAIKIIMAQPPEPRYPAYFADLLRQADVPDRDDGKCSEIPNSLDTISRQAAIDRINKQREHLEPDVYPQDKIGDAAYRICAEFIERLPSAQPDRKLIDDYMLKIKQNVSPHTTAEGVVAINYYLEQIYKQIYGEGEKPKWMS